MDLKVSKDGGAYSNTDGDAVVWKFGNNDFYLKKRATTLSDTSQVGVYTFKYTILKQWNNIYVSGTIENAFTVTVTGPPTCTITSSVCASSYNYGYDHLAGSTETIIRPTFIVSNACAGTPVYSCTDNSSGKDSNICT